VSVEIFRDGNMETIYVNLIYQPRIQPNGKTTGILVVATDVTEQVRARKKIELQAEDLQKQQRLYEAVTGNTPDLIYIFDLQYRFIFANKALLTMWGRTLQDSMGKKLLEIGYEPWHAEMHEREIDYVVATRQPIRGEVSFPHAVLGKRIYDYLFVPVINNEGQVEAIAGTTRDITEIKKAEESLKQSEAQLQIKVAERTAELERTVAELKRSNNNLEEFAYAASHDLKEPIRKIHVFSDMLKADLSPVMNEEQLYNLTRLQAASKRMSSLIDDILTYSQLNFQPGSVEKVNLNEIVKMVLNDLDLQIEQTKAVIEVGELIEIEGYSRQIQQAFHNLISNSIKYRSNDHSPLIKIEGKMIMGNETGLIMTAEQREKKYYRLQFEDNGIGFNKEDAERIFNVFTRLHDSAQYKGTGIGLSIVRKVVENHKGFVMADGNIGKGSIFKLFFPA
ncbi:MAG: PAS domain-containing protein, partial [Chitinophagaceae bacterium]|nr:PAS domain-containing protein [Chitinophagaceae bacterium]